MALRFRRGIDGLGAREIGRDELGAIQTLLAIVDAQREYAEMDPMKVGSPGYARRLKSQPGKKDGLYIGPSRPASARVLWASRSPTRSPTAGRHYGYNFRLLYGQGAAAPGGALDYLVNGRMLSFAAIACRNTTVRPAS